MRMKRLGVRMKMFHFILINDKAEMVARDEKTLCNFSFTTEP
jgi:hypothetical protein